MITFILVHGTFVRRPDWPKLVTALRDVAKQVGETASFEEVLWNGKNSVSGRRSGADRIGEKLLEVRSADPTGPVFVIAHSHGGNALAYFLSSAKDLASTLTGCAFLSTPFVAIRERPNPQPFIASLLFVPALVISVIIGTYIWSEAPSDAPLDLYFRMTLQMIPFAVGIFLFLTVKSAEASLAEAVQNQTVHMPTRNCIFLRYPGDEAAAALTALQFFALVATKIAKLIGLIYGTSKTKPETAI